MPDDSAVDTSESSGSSGEGEESGGVSQSAPASGEATDWKAKAKEYEKALAKATGKAGATQATLTEQLTAQTNRAQKAESEVAELAKQLRNRDVIDEVLAKAPEKQRGAVKLAAEGILPKVDTSDMTKAVQAVIEKITAEAPELLVKQPPKLQHMGHDTGERTQRAGLAFSASGRRLV